RSAGREAALSLTTATVTSAGPRPSHLAPRPRGRLRRRRRAPMPSGCRRVGALRARLQCDRAIGPFRTPGGEEPGSGAGAGEAAGVAVSSGRGTVPRTRTQRPGLSTASISKPSERTTEAASPSPGRRRLPSLVLPGTGETSGLPLAASTVTTSVPRTKVHTTDP